jgi:hypothetical protein
LKSERDRRPIEVPALGARPVEHLRYLADIDRGIGEPLEGRELPRCFAASDLVRAFLIGCPFMGDRLLRADDAGHLVAEDSAKKPIGLMPVQCFFLGSIPRIGRPKDRAPVHGVIVSPVLKFLPQAAPNLETAVVAHRDVAEIK